MGKGLDIATECRPTFQEQWPHHEVARMTSVTTPQILAKSQSPLCHHYQGLWSSTIPGDNPILQCSLSTSITNPITGRGLSCPVAAALCSYIWRGLNPSPSPPHWTTSIATESSNQRLKGSFWSRLAATRAAGRPEYGLKMARCHLGSYMR